MNRIRTVSCSWAAVALLAGCAGSTTAAPTSADGTSASASAGTSASASAGTSASASAGTSPTASGPGSASTKGSSVTVTGTVRAGIEQGCLVLSTPQGTYTLLGNGATALRKGARVEVQGRVDESRLTTCQQGKPLLVSRARVLS